MQSSLPEVLAAYRDARRAYLALCDRADASFRRWFEGNGSASYTRRLENEASRASATLAATQLALYRFDLDPADVDRDDGITRDVTY